MINACVVNTGILLRIFDRGDPHCANIRRLLIGRTQDGSELYTGFQILAEFWNVSTRPTAARGGYGHSVDGTRRRLAAIERVCRIMKETDASYLAWKNIISSCQITGVSVHDARLVALMQTAAISEIVTLNPSDFLRFDGLTITTP